MRTFSGAATETLGIQKDRRGEPIHGARKYNDAHGSLDIKTGFDVARPQSDCQVIAKVGVVI